MTSSANRFDDLRSDHPDLVLNLYAMTPGGAVTLEIITPDGQSYTFAGVSAEAAMLTAFPIDVVVVEAPAEPERGSIFD